MHLQTMTGREEPGQRYGKLAAGLHLAVEDPGGDLLRLPLFYSITYRIINNTENTYISQWTCFPLPVANLRSE